MDRRNVLILGLGTVAAGYFARPYIDAALQSAGEVDYLEYTHTSDNPLIVLDDFVNFANQESMSRFVMIDFHADWCPPCHAISPRLLPAALASGENVLVVKVKIQDRDAEFTNLGMISTLKMTDGLPEIQLYRNGELAGLFQGDFHEAGIASFVKEHAEAYRSRPDVFLGNPIEAPVPKNNGPSFEL